MKHFKVSLLFTISTVTFYNTALSIPLSDHEQRLIAHVKKSIEQAEQEISKLPTTVLAVPGMTSHKVKHLLNNLCSLPHATYLEIGVWKGATFTAALYNNTTLSHAIAIDNWSEFDGFNGPQQEFTYNCHNFLQGLPYTFYSHDCFSIDTTGLFDTPIDIYFYDGSHTEDCQEKAFTYYNDHFAKSFIALVDDWLHKPASIGTRAAFKKLGYTILFEKELPASKACFPYGDTKLWWNGLYIAVIRRK